ncbi:unnamed protein product [Protopolystoma xenopodis]|uniref:Uncharacterized protein n=1 Tax=Protopolystoma xenopodis TaxID=117903 RepID=A0A3S5FEV6_9PLAT|nr:unnamed protein product [Protopolystoma xenopodis]
MFLQLYPIGVPSGDTQTLCYSDMLGSPLWHLVPLRSCLRRKSVRDVVESQLRHRLSRLTAISTKISRPVNWEIDALVTLLLFNEVSPAFRSSCALDLSSLAVAFLDHYQARRSVCPASSPISMVSFIFCWPA